MKQLEIAQDAFKLAYEVEDRCILENNVAGEGFMRRVTKRLRERIREEFDAYFSEPEPAPEKAMRPQVKEALWDMVTGDPATFSLGRKIGQWKTADTE